MARITILYGALLAVLGLVAYFGTGTTSITALIPTFLGVPVLLLGFLARDERFRMHAMHVAVLLALIALVGGGWRLLSGGGTGTAFLVQVVMVVLSLIFVILAVKSFIDARRAR